MTSKHYKIRKYGDPRLDETWTPPAGVPPELEAETFIRDYWERWALLTEIAGSDLDTHLSALGDMDRPSLVRLCAVALWTAGYGTPGLRTSGRIRKRWDEAHIAKVAAEIEELMNRGYSRQAAGRILANKPEYRNPDGSTLAGKTIANLSHLKRRTAT